MHDDLRSNAAEFYDLNPDFPPDVPFYRSLIPSSTADVLELGCGTGRVTIPLAPHCRLIHGLDRSAAMIRLCRRKLNRANIACGRIVVSEGDITSFDLGRRFDLILAPFHVLQNLETDGEVGGLFRCVSRHLAPGGTCVLNVFNPLYPPEELGRCWPTPGEHLQWEVATSGGRVTCSDRRRKMDEGRLILYPDLVYRRYEGSDMLEEIVLPLVMRCFYPQEFEQLIADHGFRIVKRWGGYLGEAYGEGPELLIQFQLTA
ncbi:MAG: class I SAM-dependent methyltransferase [Acidobacteriota bacterium]